MITRFLAPGRVGQRLGVVRDHHGVQWELDQWFAQAYWRLFMNWTVSGLGWLQDLDRFFIKGGKNGLAENNFNRFPLVITGCPYSTNTVLKIPKIENVNTRNGLHDARWG